MQESGCTLFAHLPESRAFLRKACTACFPLHKNGTCRGEAPPSAIAEHSVTQTPHWGVCCFANAKALSEQGSRQLSAFVCIHQPDGFKDLLAGDFCCRRLFILPGLRCCRGQVLGIEVRFDLLGQLQPGLVLRVGVGVHAVGLFGFTGSSPGIPCRWSCGFQGTVLIWQ